MRVFLDFEASSLAKHSYPIEVAWVWEDGQAEAHLIRPAAAWTDWDPRAEALHRISREQLRTEGMAHERVAQRMLDALSQHRLYASAPSWDGKWLSTLLRAAGLPRHALRLRDTDEAQAEIARELLSPAVSPDRLQQVTAEVIAQARAAAAGRVVEHRALADAEAERRIWLDVRRLAMERAAQAAAPTTSDGSP